MSRDSTIVIPEVDTESSARLEQLYYVILLNDDDHTYDYVVEMLQKIFKFEHTRALAHTVEVDTKGSTILITCVLAEAELKRDQIHAYGPDRWLPGSVGSMAAVIELAGSRPS